MTFDDIIPLLLNPDTIGARESFDLATFFVTTPYDPAWEPVLRQARVFHLVTDTSLTEKDLYRRFILLYLAVKDPFSMAIDGASDAWLVELYSGSPYVYEEDLDNLASSQLVALYEANLINPEDLEGRLDIADLLGI